MGQTLGRIYIYQDVAYMREDIDGVTNYYRNPNDGQRSWRWCSRSEYDIAVALGKKARKNLVPWMCAKQEKQPVPSHEEVLEKMERLFPGRFQL